MVESLCFRLMEPVLLMMKNHSQQVGQWARPLMAESFILTTTRRWPLGWVLLAGVHPSICPTLQLSICPLSNYPFVQLSNYPFVHYSTIHLPTVNLFICPTVHYSLVHLSILSNCPFNGIYSFVQLSISPFVKLFIVQLSIYPFAKLFINPFDQLSSVVWFERWCSNFFFNLLIQL